MEYKTKKHLSFFAAVTALILLIPLVAMQFTAEVNWTPMDFIFAGILLFGAGAVYEFTTRNMTNPQHRVIVGIVVGMVLLFVWGLAATGE